MTCMAFITLPIESQTQILRALTPGEIAIAARVCRAWNGAIKSNVQFWNEFAAGLGLRAGIDYTRTVVGGCVGDRHLAAFQLLTETDKDWTDSLRTICYDDESHNWTGSLMDAFSNDENHHRKDAICSILSGAPLHSHDLDENPLNMALDAGLPLNIIRLMLMYGAITDAKTMSVKSIGHMKLLEEHGVFFENALKNVECIDEERLKWLLNHGAVLDPGFPERAAMHSEDTLLLAIEYCAEPEIYGSINPEQRFVGDISDTLIIACKNRYAVSTLKKLIAAGARPGSPSFINTIIGCKISEEVFCFMIEDWAQLSNHKLYFENVLNGALQRGFSLSTIKKLVELGAKINKGTLEKAIEFSSIEVVQYLITCGASYVSALDVAMHRGKEMVQCLLDQGCTPTRYTLTNAAMCSEELTLLVLRKGALPESEKQDLCHSEFPRDTLVWACRGGFSFETMNELILSGAQLTYRDILWEAVLEKCSEEVVKLLLEHGAQVSYVSKKDDYSYQERMDFLSRKSSSKAQYIPGPRETSLLEKAIRNGYSERLVMQLMDRGFERCSKEVRAAIIAIYEARGKGQEDPYSINMLERMCFHGERLSLPKDWNKEVISDILASLESKNICVSWYGEAVDPIPMHCRWSNYGYNSDEGRYGDWLAGNPDAWGPDGLIDERAYHDYCGNQW